MAQMDGRPGCCATVGHMGPNDPIPGHPIYCGKQWDTTRVPGQDRYDVVLCPYHRALFDEEPWSLDGFHVVEQHPHHTPRSREMVHDAWMMGMRLGKYATKET